MKRYEALGARLRRAREDLGLDQPTLAALVDPPVGQQAVSGWERGASRPRIAMISSIARALGLDVGELVELGGYKGVALPSAASRPLLPFENLTPDGFEDFCRDLLEHEHPGGNAYKRGERGHRQGGFDVICDDAGARIGVQVKREATFGPRKVHYAVAAADPEVGVTAPQIALSRRVATPEARDAIAAYPSWDLFDGTQLSERVLALPRERALRLVSKWFPYHVASFLGETEPSMWLHAEDWFPLSTGESMFDASLPLVGRESELAELRDFVREPGAVIVEAPSGVGKSRLVVELATGTTREVRFADARILTPNQFGLLPDPDPIVVIDDAGHDADRTAALVRGVLGERPDATLVLTVQPARRTELMEAIRDLVNPLVPTVTLGDLTRPAAKQLAEHALGQLTDHRVAELIAGIGYDCPLVILQAARLYLAGDISVAELASSSVLREAVWEKYVSKWHLPDARLRVLEAVALFQPVRMANEDMRSAVEKMSGVIGRDLELHLDRLQDAGLVRVHGSSYRVVPDLLGEAMVAKQIRLSSGVPTRTVDMAAQITGRALVHALENVSVADWHARRAGQPHSPSDVLWEAVAATAAASSASERVRLLSDIDHLGALNPSRALELVELLRAQPCGPEQDEVGRLIGREREVDQQTVMEAAAPLLASASLHRNALADTVPLLFRIGIGDSSQEHQNPSHAMRILREMGTFQPHRGIEYLDAYIDNVERLVRGSEDDSTRAIALGLLEGLTADEAEWTTSSGMTLTMHRSPVDLERVAGLRERVREIALVHIADEVRTARAAVKLLGRLVASATTQAEWLPLLEALRTVMSSSVAHPIVSLDAYHQVVRLARFGPEQLRDQARSAMAGLRDDVDFLVARQIVSAWDRLDDLFDDEESEHSSAYERLEEQLRKRNEDATQALVVAHGVGPSAALALLEYVRVVANEGDVAEGCQLLQRALIANGSASARDFLDVGGLDTPNSIDEAFLTVPLGYLLEGQPQDGLRFATRLLRSGDGGARITAWALAQCPMALEPALSAGLIASIASTKDVSASRALCIAALRHPSPLTAGAVVASLDFSKSQRLAEEAAMALSGGRLEREAPWSALAPELRRAILHNLVDAADIDDYHIRRLLNTHLDLEPFEVLDFLKARILRERTDDLRYVAIPSDWRDRPDFASSPAQARILEAAIDWYTGLDDRQRFDGQRMLEAIADGFGEAARGVALERITSRDGAVLEAVRCVLAGAPRSIVFDEEGFVTSFLEFAAKSGKENLTAATGGFYDAAIPNSWVRNVGEANPVDIDRKARCEEILSRIERSSPARPLYEALLNRSNSDIAWQLDTDRDFLEPRKW